MSKIKNDGLDQYGAEPFEQQQFGTADVERVKICWKCYEHVMCTDRFNVLFVIVFIY